MLFYPTNLVYRGCESLWEIVWSDEADNKVLYDHIIVMIMFKQFKIHPDAFDPESYV
jgi:hypothetical protein